MQTMKLNKKEAAVIMKLLQGLTLTHDDHIIRNRLLAKVQDLPEVKTKAFSKRKMQKELKKLLPKKGIPAIPNRQDFLGFVRSQIDLQLNQ